MAWQPLCPDIHQKIYEEYDDIIIADEANFNALQIAVCSLPSIDSLQVLAWEGRNSER